MSARPPLSPLSLSLPLSPPLSRCPCRPLFIVLFLCCAFCETTIKQLETNQIIFDTHDEDKSGTIDARELKAVSATKRWHAHMDP